MAKGKRAAATAKAKAAEDKEENFFRELAMECNVTAALRKAGLLRQSRQIYERRKRDPEFRARWDEAIGESYALLEVEMLERGRFGDNRPPPENEKAARQRDIPTALGMQLLRLHRSQIRARIPHAQRPMRGAKLRDELEKRLAEINRRLGGLG